MSKIYKTARGKMVDIDRVKLTNENVTAVGNMRVNARGDLLGNNGEVAMGRNQIMDQAYAVADAPYSPNDPAVVMAQQKLIEKSQAQELHNMVNNLTNSGPLEPTTPSEPPARGSLAAAAAKTASVVQQPIPTAKEQKKSQGPTRI
jgi:hypothetical protein